MKSIDTQRPPGNPIFDKKKGQNSVIRSTDSFSKIINSSIDTNASSLSIDKNNGNETKQDSGSNNVFRNSSSNLYKSKDETLS